MTPGFFPIPESTETTLGRWLKLAKTNPSGNSAISLLNDAPPPPPV